ncbi:hypothetical protein CDL12_28691 [Handroanthus impetiginosus]|uniref:SBP-type domain-containing protein n=1 Tax=Handroanthus impetiginosus TaxID=429701 RepID=A0A2G9G0H1_9LAMI|nr:hypothetical protein CDL12_28691 [Handroanthus impetiginosus]
MGSWCDFSGEKEYPCENLGLGSSKNSGLMGWVMNPSISRENSVDCSTQKSIENQEFAELGSTQMMMKFFPKGSEKILHPFTVHPNVNSGPKEEPSGLVFESNKRDSSMIDLKLGRTSDQKEIISVNHNLSCKRARPGSWNSQKPLCQVYGCKKDLSSSKDYHKRHKVCEVHSKTAKVIVNGIEQRFCQQCSRFHILAEFDNGKRSCRKRLAGHNERRRKPQVMSSSRVGRFQDYIGSRFQGTTSTSSINRLTTVLHQQKYKVDDWIKPVKVEHEADWNSPKSLLRPQTSANQNFPFLVGENSVQTTSKINEFAMQNNIMCSDISSPSFFHNSSVTQEPNSIRALSLLSTLPQDSTNPSPLVRTDGDSCYDSMTGLAKFSHSSWINLDKISLRPLSVLDNSIGSVHYGDSPIIQGTDCSYQVSEGQPTIKFA